ncbi:hypothetical protein ALC62_04065 [Cyphomyrmex costatus]|uniref:Tc1-like transposase DDE domain-containing protein n=1 Tax=Cyphomyrmex costatus TaxID=456900 RepID=A0A195CWZ1_9HYME|nr:hypothetical protein ALC62_04065 [Cyphomyrmex costatus]
MINLFSKLIQYPTRYQILCVVRRMRENGCLIHVQRPAGAPVHRRAHREEEIPDAFYDNLETIVRNAAHDFGVSLYDVHRVVHENGLRPYHYQRVQKLLSGDAQRRVNFCAGFLAQCRRNVDFPDSILWTDEATFTPNGVFNSHNHVYWGEENPHVVREGAFQHRWSINVWAGMIANQVIGPFFLPPRLNGEIYADFLRNKLPVLLADVPLYVRAQMIYQQDGAPAHLHRDVRDVLNTRYRDRWIGQGGPIAWPPRSPDINVIDFFVWGYIKELVEPRRSGTENEAREAIVAAFETITPEMVHRATRSIVPRAELCIREEGRHFEQFLN